jgi:hypothetical protein
LEKQGKVFSARRRLLEIASETILQSSIDFEYTNAWSTDSHKEHSEISEIPNISVFAASSKHHVCESYDRKSLHA